MQELKIWTIPELNSLGSCYCPSRYLPSDWSGTVLDILDTEAAPAWDRMHLVRRTLTNEQCRELALNVALQAAALTGCEDYPEVRKYVHACLGFYFENGSVLELRNQVPGLRALRKEVSDWEQHYALCALIASSARSPARAVDAAIANSAEAYKGMDHLIWGEWFRQLEQMKNIIKVLPANRR